MENQNKQQEKVVSSESSLESEINASRINALELKLETLSIITESLWNIVNRSSETANNDLQGEMARVIDDRALRDDIKVTCSECQSEGFANRGACDNCGSVLNYEGLISPFDY